MLDNLDSSDDWAPYGLDDDEDVEQEEGQNRTFIIGAIILGAVFVIGICVVVVVMLSRSGAIGGGQQADLSPNELTNQVQMTFAAETQTAVFESQQGAAEEPVETEEAGAIEAPVEGAPTTDSAVTTPTQIPTADVSTEIAEVTVVPETGGEGEAGEEGEATNTPESSIIEVTPLPVTPADSAIEEEEEEGSGGGNTDVGGSGAAITPTGSGGPVPSGSETLPETGFGGGASLAGIGLMAVALVAVVVVVRRIRLK